MSMIPIPPGETIKELCEERNIDIELFSQMMGRSTIFCKALIDGLIPLTEDVAQSLQFTLGVPARFWLNLEKIYRQDLELED